MASSDTRTEQYLGVAAHGNRADLPTAACCETRTQTLVREVAERIITEEETRAAADRVLQGEIDEIRNNPDVVDIVATYAALQAYDTTHLTDKDVIRVLADENHNDESTYYRWSTTTQTWTYIGESKQYSDFVGTDGTTAGESGLVPAPATTDAGKFLKADGTWDEVQAGPTVVQTTGASTTNVMSQDAATKMIFYSGGAGVAPGGGVSIKIGGNNQYLAGSDNPYVGVGQYLGYQARSSSNFAVTIGYNTGFGERSTGVGPHNIASGERSSAYGSTSSASGKGSVAVGAFSSATAQGQFDIGSTDTSFGYNSSAYRLLTGLYDPQSDHDAANKGYVDTAVASAGTPVYTNSAFNNLWENA